MDSQHDFRIRLLLSHRNLLYNQLPMEEEQKPDNNMRSTYIAVVIIIFLLVFLVVAMLKCIFRPNPSQQTYHSDQSDARQDGDDELAAFPVFVFGVEELPSSCCSDGMICSICLDDYVHGESIRVLPKCNHFFHKDCIDEWLSSRSLYCPICRDRAIEKNAVSMRRNCRDAAAGVGGPLALFGFDNSHINHL